MSGKYDAIQETSYLSAPSARTYRAIMRNMFLSHERMRYRLYREEILELLHRDEEYVDITDEQLKLDLDQLVTWESECGTGSRCCTYNCRIQKQEIPVLHDGSGN